MGSSPFATTICIIDSMNDEVIEKNEVLEFTHRRFPVDCHWLDGNCYFFALILLDRFPIGKILYDVIDGHFVCEIDGKKYESDRLALSQISSNNYDHQRYLASRYKKGDAVPLKQWVVGPNPSTPTISMLP